MNRDVAIGKRIAALREEAGFKQNELAKKLTWSPAVLSRIESGDRPLAPDELLTVLDGIGTADAMKLQEILERRWRMIPEPPLGDPDADLLWEAEQVAQQVHALAERPDVKQFYERRLVRYQEELFAKAGDVADKRYRATLIGTIAVGKSTAICREEGLEIPASKGMPKAVLETGAGGITICDVHVRRGPGYGLIVEPCTEDEVRQHVYDFSNFLLNPPQASRSENDDGEGAMSPGISREVERALRNMTGLRRRRGERKPDGTVIPPVDEARELTARFTDAKSLSVEILSRMELHKRDRRDIWYDDIIGKPPLEWLQEIFEHVNNGKSGEFTLPRRIELVVPIAILGEESVSVTLIDTQGIDDIAERGDLEAHFDDSHTVVVLCTVFNEAPATAVRQLLTRAIEGGVRTLDSHAAILVLPRPNEALAVKDNGFPVQSAEEGYEVKGEEVQLKLQPMGLDHLPVLFFNAAEDEPEQLRIFIRARITAVQEWHRNGLRDIIAGAKSMLENYEKDQAREAMAAAARRLTIWLDHNEKIPTKLKRHVHDSLVAAVKAAHPRTIYASVVREGDWWNLNYAHQLSHGARRIAAGIAEPKLRGFKEIADNLLQDDQFSDAHDLIHQAVRVAEAGFDALVRKAQLVGQSIHSDEMTDDNDFWRSCLSEWGKGPGYRDRINNHNESWFEETNEGEADARVIQLVTDSWHETVNVVRHLLEQD